jgi:CRP-like cAMP-binding protein
MKAIKGQKIASDDQLIKDVLSKSYVFAKASIDSLELLEKASSVKSLSKGEVLFEEGVSCESVYVLVAGRIAFFMHDEHGKRYTLGLVPEYSIFGDLEVFSREIGSSHAQAHENSKVLVINSAKFKNIVRRDPEILYRFVRFYSSLLERLVRYSLFRNVDKQLAYILVDFAHRYGSPIELDSEEQQDELKHGIEIDVHLSQEFLGSLVGIPRQRINTILKSWEESAWVKVNYSRITLINEPALKKYSII